MMDDTDARIRAANAETQRRFASMLDAGVTALPDHPLTRAYVSAERVLDALIEAVQAERRDLDEWAGDHHIYPKGPGR